jgi:hypothetical protein
MVEQGEFYGHEGFLCVKFPQLGSPGLYIIQKIFYLPFTIMKRL